MCNHYEKNVQLLFDFVKAQLPGVGVIDGFPGPEDAEHSYPKYPGPVVVQREGVRTLTRMRWGIWPFYATEKPQYLTNARNDALLTKSTWKRSARHRRCLIPATAYFEPGTGPVGARGEVRFTVHERPVFFFAGLWDTDPDPAAAFAYTMVTTEPNATAAKFQDRMPVILTGAEIEAWLGEEPLPDAQLLALCRGLPAEALLFEERAVPPKLKVTKKHAASSSGPEQGTLF